MGGKRWPWLQPVLTRDKRNKFCGDCKKNNLLTSWQMNDAVDITQYLIFAHFIFVWHFLLYLCPTWFSHKFFLDNLNSEAFEVSNQIAWHQLNLSCVFVVHLPINALLVRSHNVLLERVQSNQKLAPHLGHNNNNSSHVAWRLCNILILQFQRRHNVEAIFCTKFYCTAKFRLWKLPISRAKYLAGCQEQRTVILWWKGVIKASAHYWYLIMI